MTCVDSATYQKAVLDCAAVSSIKGLGSPNYVRRGHIRGVGITAATDLIVPTSVAYDPCAIAAQTPCAQGDGTLVCGAGTFKSCLATRPGTPLQCNCLKVATTPAAALLPMTTTMTATPAAATAGFSQWGLVAALAAAGIGYVAYAYSKKKKVS